MAASWIGSTAWSRRQWLGPQSARYIVAREPQALDFSTGNHDLPKYCLNGRILWLIFRHSFASPALGRNQSRPVGTADKIEPGPGEMVTAHELFLQSRSWSHRHPGICAGLSACPDHHC